MALRRDGAFWAVAGACGVLAAIVALPATASTLQAVAPFTINPLPPFSKPGQVLTVTGSGCPATSALTVPTEPLALQLHAPGGAVPLSPLLNGSTVDLVIPDIGKPGTVNATVTPAADGSFSASITIPTGAPSVSGYTVDGVCTTLLVAGGATPSGFTNASLAAANASAGSLTIVVDDAASNLPADQPAATAPQPVVATPGFTG